MKLSNDKGHRAPAGHLLSPNEAFSTRTGLLHLIELLAKGVPWEPETTQAIVKMAIVKVAQHKLTVKPCC